MITIIDVARRAGVSVTTVSHALSGKRPVSATTRARIEQAIVELGFRPSALARSFRMQRTQMVALIIPDIRNPYYSVLASGLQDVLIEEGYQIFLCSTGWDKERTIKFITDALQRQADGLVIAAFDPISHEIEDVIKSSGKEHISLVCIGRGIDHQGIDRVTTDNEGGAIAAMRHLVARGHRRIAMVTGISAGIERTRGYRSVLEEADIPFDETLIVRGDYLRPGGVLATRQLLSLPRPPTAIFCANDLMAIGAMDAAREAGLTIPHDLALVGYDDIEVAALVSPGLTTVLNPAYDIGKTAGQLLLERMSGTYEGPRRDCILPYKFIQRAST